ncbi:chromate efflux transporter [Citricoccus muralis]|uniref:Chromate efflux transporter n=1 Tax=Citricoccus muralis TaxID=169134 RepID=A0ABY8H829_9MICC|nr:chromate efflux transporter [Citricoccus muralis]WFP16818.1 chromate efflux transporter [Citricoccus muralis]
MNESTGPEGRGGQHAGSVAEVFWVFLRLGLTSFGGPVAHLGYFREAFVQRRKWLSDAVYADLVALCQFLPGPASSQVGMAIGLQRAGMGGLFAAWFAFTMPSAIVLVAFAYGMASFGDAAGTGWLDGLKAAAVAVVAQAVLGMAKSLTPDAKRASIAAAAMIAILLVGHPLAQIGAIVMGGLLGLTWLRAETTEGGRREHLEIGVSRTIGALCLGLFALLLVAFPVLAALTAHPGLELADLFYRAGALVFGGGHVVLPLLEAETVHTGLVDGGTFLAGYGAAQAVPGPLFTFAAFLGASSSAEVTEWAGAAIALVAVFLPATLLVVGALPFWERLRHSRIARRALLGINASVVGVLAAALYDPVFTQGITSPATLALAVAVFIAQVHWKLPAWAAVIGAGIIGFVLL